MLRQHSCPARPKRTCVRLSSGEAFLFHDSAGFDSPLTASDTPLGGAAMRRSAWHVGGGSVHRLARVSESAVVEAGAVVGPAATVGDDCRIGAGSVVGADVVIGPRTVLGCAFSPLALCLCFVSLSPARLPRPP